MCGAIGTTKCVVNGSLADTTHPPGAGCNAIGRKIEKNRDWSKNRGKFVIGSGGLYNLYIFRVDPPSPTRTTTTTSLRLA
jgi:hypothetical protein